MESHLHDGARLPGEGRLPAKKQESGALGKEGGVLGTFTASAPCKAILFGEHYVVYGSPALSVAIEPRNIVKFSEGPAGANQSGGIHLKSAIGSGKISAAGRYAGQRELSIYAEVARTVFGVEKMPDCTVEFLPAWKLKGVGASASLCAALAAGLYRLKGQPADSESVFEAAQAGDLFAHGGRASGIDAKTVSYGIPLVFQRSFAPLAFASHQAEFSMPEGAELLLVDTNIGKRDGTAKMLAKFASRFGVKGSPVEAKEEERQKIRKEYAHLWEKITRAMKGADAKTLGSLMNENHKLLKKRKMSSDGIDKAVSSAISAGAYGAKMTGGGGEGGAALALFGKKDAAAAAARITDETCFACHRIVLAASGACAD